MWSVAWQQMRASAGRLGAAAIAIILGSAFVAATLLAAATMESTTHRAVAAGYAEADLVINAEGRSEGLGMEDVAELAAVPGVAAAHPQSFAGTRLEVDERSEWTSFGPAPTDERLTNSVLREGHWPTQAHQVAVDADLASRLGIALDDEVTLAWQDDEATDSPAADAAPHAQPVHVVGMLESPSSYFTIGQQVLTDATTFSTWWQQAGASGDMHFFEAMTVLDDGADVAQVRAAIETALPGVTVQTVTERAAELTAMYTGDEDLLTAVGLAFAAVSLAVAALVIANTFTVLIAQRTRTLALLRCVGASRAQIRRSVFIEAAGLGLASAAVGLGLAVAVVTVGLNLLSNANPQVPLDGAVHLTPAVVLTTLLTGLVVTLGAAAVPARLATRVAPLAALHPVEGSPERRAGRIRAVLTGLGLVSGSALLVGAAMLARGSTDSGGLLTALGIGVLGGLIALTALLVGAVFIVPALIGLVQRLLGRAVPARVAAANALRNPRRTGATASALMIGVALVTMMSTGALIAQETFSRTLDGRLSVDLTVEAGPGTPLADPYLQVLRDHEQISEIALLHGAHGDLESERAGTVSGLLIAGIAEGDLDQVLRDPAVGATVPDGVVIVPRALQSWYGLADGEQVTVTSQGTQVRLQVQLSGIEGHLALVPDAVAAQLQTQVSAAWVRFTDGADEMQVVREVQAGLTEAQTGARDDYLPSLGGSGVERAGYQQVINTLLIVVVALIGVSVVIALVGVANTLSLSVLERRRESAMLRALGLTRGQLRAMLAIEAVLISGAGTLIGTLAGIGFGWAGATVLLAEVGQVPLLVPWRDVALVCAVALAAGLLASVLPARSAVRSSPVAALAAP